MSAPVATIVLTGGASRRMGRHKPAVEFDGVPFVARVLAAAPDGPVVVVGKVGGIPPNTVVITEDPPGSGPVAGIAAGLRYLRSDAAACPHTVLTLASDLPLVTRAYLDALVATAQGDSVDVAVAEREGAANWLCAAWRYDALVEALEHGDANGRSVRSLFADRRVVALPDELGVSSDVDTPEELRALRARRPRNN